MGQGGKFSAVITVLIIGFLTLLFGSFLPKLQVQKTIDIFYDKQSPTYKEFSVWQSQFGSDDRIIVAWKSPYGFNLPSVSTVIDLTSKFEEIPGVVKVQSLSSVSDIWGEGEDFYAEPPFRRGLSIQELAEVRDRVLNNPLFVGNLVSRDGSVFSWIVFVAPEVRDKSEVIEKVTSIMQRELKGQDWHLSGSAVIDYFYTRYMEEDLRTFLPIVLGLIFLVLLITFRSIGGILFPFLTILVSLVWSMSLLYFFKFPINNVTTIIPPIIVAIGIADSVHFVSEILQRHRRERRKIDALLIRDTIRDLIVPCFLTSVTTSIGFLSLTVSRIEPVKQLGIVASIGVILALIITFTLLPSLLYLFPALLDKEIVKVNFSKEDFDFLLRKIVELNRKYAGTILIGAILIVAGSIYFARKVRTETSMINYFKKNTEVYKSTVFIQNHLGGIHFINISLYSGREDFFKRAKVLHRIEDLEEFLRSQEKVDKVLSVNEYLKLMNQALHQNDPQFYRLPDKDSTIRQYLLLYDIEDMSDFVTEDWDWVTIRVRTSENSSLKLMEMVERIRNHLKRSFSDLPLRTSVVGRSVLEAETNELVTKGQIKSLSLAFVLIFLLMFFVFKSIKVGFLSMVPNVVPLLMNFGLMGLLGINLDSATSMISAVGIGIIVDDTIHFLHAFLGHFSATKKIGDSVERAIMDKGSPIMFTSLILFFGFVILSVSRFSPTASFGILTSLLMINALVSDLFVLPSLLFTLEKIKTGGRE